MKKALFIGLFLAFVNVVFAQKVEFRDGGALATLSSKLENITIKSRDNRTYYMIRFDNVIFITLKNEFQEMSAKLEAGGAVRVDSWAVSKDVLFSKKKLYKAGRRMGISLDRVRFYKIIKFSTN